jgi:hypothetical protein
MIPLRDVGIRRIGAVVLLVGSLAGCQSSGSRDSAPTSATTAPSTPRFDVVLDDSGLKLPSHRIRAGRYLISFRDSRSRRPAGDKVVLRFSPSGPDFVLLEIPAGSHRIGTLYQNEVPWVAINGERRNVGGEGPLTIEPTPQYPTPVT